MASASSGIGTFTGGNAYDPAAQARPMDRTVMYAAGAIGLFLLVFLLKKK